MRQKRRQGAGGEERTGERQGLCECYVGEAVGLSGEVDEEAEKACPPRVAGPPRPVENVSGEGGVDSCHRWGCVGCVRGEEQGRGEEKNVGGARAPATGCPRCAPTCIDLPGLCPPPPSSRRLSRRTPRGHLPRGACRRHAAVADAAASMPPPPPPSAWWALSTHPPPAGGSTTSCQRHLCSCAAREQQGVGERVRTLCREDLPPLPRPLPGGGGDGGGREPAFATPSRSSPPRRPGGNGHVHGVGGKDQVALAGASNARWRPPPLSPSDAFEGVGCKGGEGETSTATPPPPSTTPHPSPPLAAITILTGEPGAGPPTPPQHPCGCAHAPLPLPLNPVCRESTPDSNGNNVTRAGGRGTPARPRFIHTERGGRGGKGPQFQVTPQPLRTGMGEGGPFRLALPTIPGGVRGGGPTPPRRRGEGQRGCVPAGDPAPGGFGATRC